MTETGQLENHISSLSAEKWSTLFSLLPEIEQTENFGVFNGVEELDDGSISLLGSEPGAIVDKFFTTIHSLGIVPVFDWNKWEEGQKILLNPAYDFNTTDIITLCKLFTLIMRTDRFTEGYLISRFQDGTIAKIIRAMKQKID